MVGFAHRMKSATAGPATGWLRTVGACLAAVLCGTSVSAQSGPSSNFPFPDDDPYAIPAPAPGYAGPGYAGQGNDAGQGGYADPGYGGTPAQFTGTQLAARPGASRYASRRAEDLPPPPPSPDGGVPGPGAPPAGFPSQGYPVQGYSPYDEVPLGYPPPGYPQFGYPPPGYPVPNADDPGFPAPGYPGPVYVPPGHDGNLFGIPGQFMEGCADCGDGGDYFDGGPECGPNHPCTPKKKFADLGLGAEALPFATFELDTARPSNYYRFRMDSVKRWLQPDKIEYLMARQGGSGKGTANIDSFVNFIDMRMAFEAGGDKIGVLTEIPIRALDSEFNGNNVGLGDMSVAPKIMIMDEGHLQITQITRIIILTGYFTRGLGTGHMSMEPGFLMNYKMSCTTYLHGEFKYWFPIGADFTYTGTMFRYGFGISHLLYERPHQDFAIIPVLEFVGYTILDGAASDPLTGGFVDVGPQTIVNCLPGVRVMVAEGAEVGLQLGFNVTSTQFYSGMIRAEVRINY